MDLNSRQIVNEDSILLYFGGHVIDIMEFTSSFESFKKVIFFLFFWLKQILNSAHLIFLKKLTNTKENKEKEKSLKVDKDLSSIICYCQAKSFDDKSKILFKKVLNEFLAIIFFCLDYEKNKYFEICSFSDNRKYFLNDWPFKFNSYHNRVLSRVYPAYHRVNSLNYDPNPYWECGFQLVALNYQAPGS